MDVEAFRKLVHARTTRMGGSSGTRNPKGDMACELDIGVDADCQFPKHQTSSSENPPLEGRKMIQVQVKVKGAHHSDCSTECAEKICGAHDAMCPEELDTV